MFTLFRTKPKFHTVLHPQTFIANLMVLWWSASFQNVKSNISCLNFKSNTFYARLSSKTFAWQINLHQKRFPCCKRMPTKFCWIHFMIKSFDKISMRAIEKWKFLMQLLFLRKSCFPKKHKQESEWIFFHKCEARMLKMMESFMIQSKIKIHR